MQVSFSWWQSSNFNKDADAHKKKLESLSPKEKVSFVKNNTATQRKHCKSLYPEQKAQVLTLDAAEHKKHQESLSLERKA